MPKCSGTTLTSLRMQSVFRLRLNYTLPLRLRRCNRWRCFWASPFRMLRCWGADGDCSQNLCILRVFFFFGACYWHVVCRCGSPPWAYSENFVVEFTSSRILSMQWQVCDDHFHVPFIVEKCKLWIRVTRVFVLLHSCFNFAKDTIIRTPHQFRSRLWAIGSQTRLRSVTVNMQRSQTCMKVTYCSREGVQHAGSNLDTCRHTINIAMLKIILTICRNTSKVSIIYEFYEFWTK